MNGLFQNTIRGGLFGNGLVVVLRVGCVFGIVLVVSSVVSVVELKFCGLGVSTIKFNLFCEISFVFVRVFVNLKNKLILWLEFRMKTINTPKNMKQAANLIQRV